MAFVLQHLAYFAKNNVLKVRLYHSIYQSFILLYDWEKYFYILIFETYVFMDTAVITEG